MKTISIRQKLNIIKGTFSLPNNLSTYGPGKNNLSVDKIFVLTLYLYYPSERSMSAGPRYHGPRVWARDRGDTVRWAVRTLPRALGGEDRSPDWSGPGWRSSHQWRPVRRSEPRRFTSAPPRRPFMGSSEPGRWRPHYCEEERRSNWQRPPVQRPGDWRISPDPTERPARRGDQGPPLAPARVVE